MGLKAIADRLARRSAVIFSSFPKWKNEVSSVPIDTVVFPI